jgi:hypothetical protein
MTSCSLVDEYQTLGGTHCMFLQNTGTYQPAKLCHNLQDYTMNYHSHEHQKSYLSTTCNHIIFNISQLEISLCCSFFIEQIP